jgi:hypothetical protein
MDTSLVRLRRRLVIVSTMIGFGGSALVEISTPEVLATNGLENVQLRQMCRLTPECTTDIVEPIAQVYLQGFG